jgi:hypothetical protein
MLGPTAVMGTLDGERLPVNVALAKYVRDRLGSDYAELDYWKPASVAQVALREEDPVTLGVWVDEFYQQFEDDETELTNLAHLPFQLVLNTSPLPSVYRAFAKVKERTHSDFYDRTGRDNAMLPEASIDAPVVYHLYGTLDEPQSMILSESDRLNFIVSVASGEPPLPRNLTSALRDNSRAFLFLGFDLTDWQLRVLLHVLDPRENDRRRIKSFAFEFEDAPVDDATREFYKEGHRIHFFSGELDAFTSELRQRVEADMTTEPAEKPAVSHISPDAPVVFLCHASEDKPIAERLALDLRNAGIGTWLDKENLRGGDRWDSIINETISKEVNYVVVLQSEALLAKEVGYVNREINAALYRQQEYREPRRFLIPVVVDSEENQLRELRDLHYVDLTAGGAHDLVKTIKRDIDYAQRAVT